MVFSVAIPKSRSFYLNSSLVNGLANSSIF
nr:MAG TPA: hypothetical protein [Caudoviricetes sp.]